MFNHHSFRLAMTAGQFTVYCLHSLFVFVSWFRSALSNGNKKECMEYMLKDGSRSSEIIFHYFGSLFSGVCYRARCYWQTCYMGMEKYIPVILLAFPLLQIDVSFSGWLFLFTFWVGITRDPSPETASVRSRSHSDTCPRATTNL
jgi:hypothetical protein